MTERIERHWNWRTSGHFRLLSLGTVWMIVFASPWLGLLLLPFGLLRTAASMAQLLLNSRLGRRHPLAPRDPGDWALLGLTFLAACAASALAPQGTVMARPDLLLLVLLPFSAIQIRMCLRSYRAHGPAAVRAGRPSAA